MDNTQEIKVVEKTQKDYWKLTYQNFLHISYFGFFILLVSIAIIVFKVGPYEYITILGVLQIFIFSLIWFIISKLFKNHNESAVIVGYIILGILTAYSLFPTFNIIGLLINGYFFYLVYKTSKMPKTIN